MALLERVRKLEDKLIAIFKIIDGNVEKRQKRAIETAEWRTKAEIRLNFAIKLMWSILITLIGTILTIVGKFLFDFMSGG